MDKKRKQFYEAFKKQVIYLWEDESETFVKSDPAKGFTGHLAGGEEFKLAPDSDIVIRAVEAFWRLSETEYKESKVPAAAS